MCICSALQILKVYFVIELKSWNKSHFNVLREYTFMTMFLITFLILTCITLIWLTWLDCRLLKYMTHTFQQKLHFSIHFVYHKRSANVYAVYRCCVISLCLLHSWNGSKVHWLLRRNESLVPGHISLEKHTFSFSVSLSTQCNYRRVKL